MNKISSPIERAYDLFDSQMDFANACGVSQVTVHKWLNGGGISPENAKNIETATHARDPHQVVYRWELNPVFDKPEEAA